MVWGGGLSTFDAGSQSAKIPNSLYGRRGVLGFNFQLLMLSPNLLKSQIPYMVGGWRGGGLGPNFQLLMLSLNLLNPKNFIVEVLIKSVPCQEVHLDYYMVRIHYVYAGP